MLRLGLLASLAAVAHGAHVRKAASVQLTPDEGATHARASELGYLDPLWKTEHVHAKKGRGRAVTEDEPRPSDLSGPYHGTNEERSHESNIILVIVMSAFGSIVGAGATAELLQHLEKADVERQIRGLGERADLILCPWLLGLGWVFMVGVQRALYARAHKDWTCWGICFYCCWAPVLTAVMVWGQVLWVRGVVNEKNSSATMGRMMAGSGPVPWGVVSHVVEGVAEDVRATVAHSRAQLVKGPVRNLFLILQLLVTSFGVYLLMQPHPGQICNNEVWWAAFALTTSTACMLLVVIVTLACVFFVRRALDDMVQLKEEWSFVIRSLFLGEDEEDEEEHISASPTGSGIPVEVVSAHGKLHD